MKRKEIILLALVVLLGAGAVTGGQAGGHLDEQNRVAAVEPQDIVAGQQGLGFALLKVLSSRAAGQNVFISPLSVSTAFSMACAGARGDTRAKLSQALRLPSADQAAINKGFRGLVAGIAGRSAEIAVEIADSIFVSSKYKLEPAFVQQARTFFDAEVQSLDFASAGAPARVNAWVSQKTHGKIPEIVQRINPGSVTILLNAAYFKGPWSTPFKKAATREADFHLASGSSKKVQMMRQVAFIDYLKRKDFQAVSLPYKDPRFAACIFLPDKSSSLDALRKGLSPDMWRSWMGKLSARHGELALPRFKLKYSTSLKEAMTALGAGVAFDPEKADFSGMHAPPPPLSISEARHKTYLSVDEFGTEAAAATEIAMMGASAMVPAEEFHVIVDRPFLFAIVHKDTGAILFIGSIYEPG